MLELKINKKNSPTKDGSQPDLLESLPFGFSAQADLLSHNLHIPVVLAVPKYIMFIALFTSSL